MLRYRGSWEVEAILYEQLYIYIQLVRRLGFRLKPMSSGMETLSKINILS